MSLKDHVAPTGHNTLSSWEVDACTQAQDQAKAILELQERLAEQGLSPTGRRLHEGVVPQIVLVGDMVTGAHALALAKVLAEVAVVEVVSGDYLVTGDGVPATDFAAIEARAIAFLGAREQFPPFNDYMPDLAEDKPRYGWYQRYAGKKGRSPRY